jgi:hypothetical protein
VKEVPQSVPLTKALIARIVPTVSILDEDVIAFEADAAGIMIFDLNREGKRIHGNVDLPWAQASDFEAPYQWFCKICKNNDVDLRDVASLPWRLSRHDDI